MRLVHSAQDYGTHVMTSWHSDHCRQAVFLGRGLVTDEDRTRQGFAERMRVAVLIFDGDDAVQGAHLTYWS